MNPNDDHSLLARFDAVLSPDERGVVALARGWAARQRAPLYAVGGSVRDLLLGRAHLDLDLAVGGDAGALAHCIAAELGGRATTYAHFGTATVSAPGWSVDIARTRTERYVYAGALPVVDPAPIEADLARRDFSIHAMAIALTGADAGRLIDPYGGRADLEARSLRVLHGESFRDDPTRIMRLARYAARLSFAVEPGTEALARRDTPFIPAVNPARITHELERTFAEVRPERVLRRLERWHALRALFAGFALPAALEEGCERLRSDGGPAAASAEYLALIAAHWDRAAIQALPGALELGHDTLIALRDLPSARATLVALVAAPIDPVTACDQLAALNLAAVRGAAAAAGDPAAALVRRFIADWRALRPALRGNDLLALGVPVGPAVGWLLDRLRRGKLQGELRTAADEAAIVHDWLEARQNEPIGGRWKRGCDE